MEASAASLYDRLGGIYSIATVVDDFIDRIMVDERLNANPRVDEAHHRVLPPGFKYLVTEMLAEAAGGPQRYTGRPMEESHREMLNNTGRVARVHGRPQPNARQVRRAGAGTLRGRRDGREHT